MFGMEVSEFMGKAALLVGAAVVACVICHVVSRFLRKALNATDVPSASIFINIARGLIWAFCLLAVVQPVFGISPTALVTALGVTSLAISLGLQNTISNIISGLELMAGKVVQPGDIVEVNGFRGEVVDVTWRSTSLRDRAGNVQIIPNSVLNETALTRLTPHAAVMYKLELVVAHGADLDSVAKEIKDTALTCLEGKLTSEPGPIVHFVGSDVYGVQCQVLLYLQDCVVPSEVCDTLMRQLANRPWVASEQ